MQEIVFISLSIIESLLLIFCICNTIRNKNKYTSILVHVYIVGIIVIASYVLSIITPGSFLPYFFQALYSSSIDWILYLLAIFLTTLFSIRLSVRSQFILVLVRTLIITDCFSLLINPFTFVSFDLIIIPLRNGINVIQVVKYWLYMAHLYLCYLIILEIVFIMIKKINTYHKFFRRKYINILIIFVVIILLNAIFMIFNLLFDFSLLLYDFLAIYIYLFTNIELPKANVLSMLQFVTDEVPIGIMCYDIDGLCIYVNSKGKKILPPNGYIFDEANYYRSKLLMLHSDKEYSNFKEHDIFIIDNKTLYYDIEYCSIKDENGIYSGSYIKLKDVSESVLKNNQQRQKATHDSLTGVYNREAFCNNVREILNNNTSYVYYLIVTNIQSFKLINDLHGTSFGDLILKEQSELLLRINHPGCIHGRIGSDHFAMLIPKKIFNSYFLEANLLDNIKYSVELSYKIITYIGVYEIKDKSENIQSMIDKAFVALNSGNDESNKTIFFYNQNSLEKMRYAKNLIGEFKYSLTLGQFHMYLQPQYDIKTEKVVGSEALIRWIHPTMGVLYPRQFVSIIESTDFIFMLDSYIWEQAAIKLSEWKKIGIQLYISVNISTKDFYYGDLYDYLTKLVEKYDIEPKFLKLEITETVLINDLQLHKGVINKLKNYGFIIEMDDFGSGYSSLNTLQEIDMDVIKMDMEFLKNSKNEDRSYSILSHLIKMIKELNMQIIAEGVDSKEKIEFLREIGCDLAQGYFFSKPLSIIEFEKKYINGKENTDAVV